MSTPEKKEETKKLHPPVELPKCSYATEPPSPDDYGDIITVIVGEGGPQRKFNVYEGLLKHYSSYFRTALKKEWIEGQLKTITLSTEDPETFRAFFHWLSNGKLYSRLATDGTIPLTTRSICEIFVFGDAHGIPELCNAATDLLFQNLMQTWSYPKHDLEYVYENTPDNTLLRKYLVDYAFEKFGFAQLGLSKSIYPKDFLIDVMEQAVAKGEKLSYLKDWAIGKYVHWKKLQICSKYHDHSSSDASTSS